MLLTAAVAAALACGDANDAPSKQADAAVSNNAGNGSPKTPTTPTPDAHARKLATSGSHTCALRKTGLFCWGANDKGQLGDESTNSSATPVEAKVAGTGVVEVAVHTGRTCVRKQTGKVACWGANDAGQLGDGTRTDALKAFEPDIDDAKQLALDEKSTCVLRAGGSVWCWGASPDSAPDQGSTAPSAIAGIEGATDLHSGAMNAYCARIDQLGTKCWHIEGGAWSAPKDATALTSASAIALASGQEVCGLQSSGEVVCQDLAGGTSLPLPGSLGTTQIVGGLLTLCGGDSAGAWYCWNILSPAVLQAIGAQRRELSRGPFFEFSTAGYRYCGLEAGGQVQCMESNAPSPQFSAVSDLPD